MRDSLRGLIYRNKRDDGITVAEKKKYRFFSSTKEGTARRYVEQEIPGRERGGVQGKRVSGKCQPRDVAK